MMDMFNLVSGIVSIASFFISIFVAGKVIKISNSIGINSNNSSKDNSKNQVVQNASGQGIQQIGRDNHVG